MTVVQCRTSERTVTKHEEGKTARGLHIKNSHLFCLIVVFKCTCNFVNSNSLLLNWTDHAWFSFGRDATSNGICVSGWKINVLTTTLCSHSLSVSVFTYAPSLHIYCHFLIEQQFLCWHPVKLYEKDERLFHHNERCCFSFPGLFAAFLKDQSSRCSRRVVLDQDCGRLPALSMDSYTDTQLFSVSLTFTELHTGWLLKIHSLIQCVVEVKFTISPGIIMSLNLNCN